MMEVTQGSNKVVHNKQRGYKLIFGVLVATLGLLGSLLAIGTTALNVNVVETANAGSSGTGNTGTGGSCSYSGMYVRLVKKTSDVKFGGRGCKSSSKGWNFNSKTKTCYKNRSKMINIWYLSDQSKYWGMWPNQDMGVSAARPSHWRDIIKQSYSRGAINTVGGKFDPRKVRDEAIKEVDKISRDVIVVCVWGKDSLSAPLRCPTFSASAPASDVRRWVRPGRSGAVIPAANNTSDAARGTWCFSGSYPMSFSRYVPLVMPNPTNPLEYSWRCTASKKDIEGQPTEFKTQQGDVVYTPLGKLLNASSSTPSASQITTENTKRGTVSRCNIALTDQNKEALAEGGVMNVVEFTQRAEMRSVSTTVQEYRCSTVVTYAFTYTKSRVGNLRPASWSNLCDRNAPVGTGGWVAYGGPQVKTVNSILTQTPFASNLNQTLSVHGNSGDFGVGFKDALLAKNNLPNGASTAVHDISNGDASKYYSGSARTSSIGWVQPGSIFIVPTNFPVWGDGAADPRGTNTDGFFDKEVAFEGRLITPSDSAAVVRPRDNSFREFNFARYGINYGGVVTRGNVINEATPEEDLNTEGQVGDDNGGDEDGWTFDSDAVVDEDDPEIEAEEALEGASEAITTTITRWTNGTPTIRGTNSDVGSFKMWEEGSWNVLSSDWQDQGANQTNWSASEGKTQTWGQIKSDFDHVMVAASWASEKARPQVFTIRWEYLANVNNTLPTTVGFGVNALSEVTTGVVGVPVQGKVQGRSDNAPISPALHEQQERYTGSGTTNNFDGVLYWGTNLDNNKRWLTKPPNYSPYYYSLQFVRVVGE